VRLIAQHQLEAKAIAEVAGVSRASVFNYPTLARLERHIEAVAKVCLQPAKVASLIHDWLLDQVNDCVPA
jgi:hypothetical protein